MFKPEFFGYLSKVREAEMGLADVKAWLGRTGSFGWGKEDVELYLTVILPHMGSRDILGALFSSPTKRSQIDAHLKVVRLQLIVPFRIYHTIRQNITLLELRNSTSTTKLRVRQSMPSLAALLACVVFRLQSYHPQMISGVLKMTLKNLEPFSLCLSPYPSFAWSDSLSQIHPPSTPTHLPTISR